MNALNRNEARLLDRVRECGVVRANQHMAKAVEGLLRAGLVDVEIHATPNERGARLRYRVTAKTFDGGAP